MRVVIHNHVGDADPYAEGRRARANGAAEFANPYVVGREHKAGSSEWERGWRDQDKQYR